MTSAKPDVVAPHGDQQHVDRPLPPTTRPTCVELRRSDDAAVARGLDPEEALAHPGPVAGGREEGDGGVGVVALQHGGRLRGAGRPRAVARPREVVGAEVEGRVALPRGVRVADRDDQQVGHAHRLLIRQRDRPRVRSGRSW